MTNMLHILGASLARVIGEDEVVCRGVLRLTIMNSVDELKQVSDPGKATTQTIAYIKKMTYQDWKTIIEDSSLHKSLASIGINNSAPVIAQLRQTLVEQQSLFTMTAH